MKAFVLLALALLFASASLAQDPQAETQAWFREARFGMFIHWGVYSVLGDGEWVMHNRQMPVEDYEKLPEQFNPVDFDPAEWVRVAKRAGMRYITITSKHHDGFAMWDSKVSDYNIVDATPYGKDVLKMLAEECARQGIELFFYHSHLDWRHPDYYPRGKTGQHSGRPDEGDFDSYLDYMDAQVAELASGDYGQLAGFWFDGWWDQHINEDDKADRSTHVDWRLSQTYDLIHRLQPQAIIGNNHHVLPFEGEGFQMFERDLPGENQFGYNTTAIGELPLETCDTMNGAWGYNAADHDFKSSTELVHYLVRAAGYDANFLLNVGPTPQGTFQPEVIERLEAVGEWTSEFGETIYGTRGGPMAPQSWGVMTRTPGSLYVHVLDGSASTRVLPGTQGITVRRAYVFGSHREVTLRGPPAGRSR
jgi:alpha-L-fucosidase